MCSAQLPFVLPAAATTRAGSLGQALNERKQHVYNVAPRGTFSRARESFGQHPHDNLASMPWQPGTGFRPTALPRGGRDCIHWTTEVNGPTGRLRLCRGAEQSLRLYQRAHNPRQQKLSQEGQRRPTDAWRTSRQPRRALMLDTGQGCARQRAFRPCGATRAQAMRKHTGAKAPFRRKPGASGT